MRWPVLIGEVNCANGLSGCILIGQSKSPCQTGVIYLDEFEKHFLGVELMLRCSVPYDCIALKGTIGHRSPGNEVGVAVNSIGSSHSLLERVIEGSEVYE
jgi:hypothetical protein